MDFKNAGALETHIKARHPDIRQNREPAQVKKATREKFTLEQKIRALEIFYDCASDDSVLFPYQDTAKKFFGVAWQAHRSYIGKWLKQADKFSDAVADLRAMKCRTDERARIGRVRKADFPEEEDELYRCFIERRLVHGYPVNYYWLRRKFAVILENSQPPGWASAKCSWGWAVRFCVRYKLSTQRSNNTKSTDLKSRIGAVKDFHRFLHLVLQPSPGANPRHPKYGRFGPAHFFHVDQVPLPFACGRKTTLHPKNMGTVRIAAPSTAGLEKRQATLQLWICALAGRQVIKPTIIFRGQRGGLLPKPAEKDVFDALPSIRVAFQRNAWADEEFCATDILNVAADLADAEIEGEVLIAMDRHAAQKTQAMKRLYKQLGMVPLFTPPNCTDCVSPVDHHVGRFIEAHMARSYQDELESNPHIWIAGGAEPDDDGGFDLEDSNSNSAMHRRMLMAKWLSDAWSDLITRHSLLQNAFVETGLLLALDGSEDRQISLQGWNQPESYSFR